MSIRSQKPRRYQKIPIVIEAIEWDGKNRAAIIAFAGECAVFDAEGGLLIETLEGLMRCNVGSMVIKGIHGECYPCQIDIFNKTYRLDMGVEV